MEHLTINEIIDKNLVEHCNRWVIDKLKTEINTEISEMKTILRNTLQSNSSMGKEIHSMRGEISQLKHELESYKNGKIK